MSQNNGSNAGSADGQTTIYVKLRGLPYAANDKEVNEFFAEKAFLPKKIYWLLTPDGRASGECFCQLDSLEQWTLAMELDKKQMGTRYVDVLEATESDLNSAIADGAVAGFAGQGDSDKETVVRLRGLPYSSSEEDVHKFFEGLKLVAVKIVKNSSGRSTGEGYVKLASGADGAKALTFNKKHLGSRYIEVFRSSPEEFENNGFLRSSIEPIVSNRPAPRPSRGGGPSYGGYGYNNDYGRNYDNYGYQRPAPYNVPMRGGRGGRGGGGGGGSYGGYSNGDRRGQYGDYDGYERGRGYDREERNANPGPHSLFLRGLPFNVNVQMLESFFEDTTMVDIKVGLNHEGRLSGDGLVHFGNAGDVITALNKNHQEMGTRYIELFQPQEAPLAMRRQTFRTLYSAAKSDHGYGDEGGYGWNSRSRDREYWDSPNRRY